MKKILLSLAAAAMAMSGMAAEASYTIEFKNADNNNGSSISETVTDYVETGANYISGVTAQDRASLGMYGLKIGQNKTQGSATLGLTADAQVVPTKVEIKVSANKNPSSQKFSFNGADAQALANTNDSYQTLTYTDFTATLTSLKFEKTEDTSASSNQGFIYVKSVTVYYESDGPAKSDPNIHFAEESYTATLGLEFESPVAMVNHTPAEITYSSSDTDVATVDATTGVVTLVAGGTTTITAVVSANDKYLSGVASYTLKVIDPSVLYSSVLGEDFEFEQVSGTVNPWSHDSQYGLKGSAFVNNAINACEAVAYSPVLDMTNFEEITLNFDQAFNQYKVDNALISIAEFEDGEYAGLVIREEGDSNWASVLDGITSPTKFSWTYNANDPVSLNSYAGKKVQIGFRYKSDNYCAGTWEIKNIKVNGTIKTGVEEVMVDANAPAVYYNLQGVRVANPEKGLYIRVQGNTTKKVAL